jgi:serine O-acetyltransferase
MVGTALYQQGAWAVIEYRMRRWGRSQPQPLRLAFAFLGRISMKLVEILTGISLPTGAEFGPGLYIGHFGGIFVHPRVVAGAHLTLSQDVAIGVSRGGVPRIGDRVYIGPGAKVFGGITIGDRTSIGANAVVHFDTPPGATVVGNPATVTRVDPLRER